MVKLTNVSKSVAVGVVLAAGLLMPTRIASADTSSSFVPNTTTCSSAAVTQNTNGGIYTAKWDNGHTFTLTVTKAPTSDVTLFASSYHITNNQYVGGCFGAAGTAPQTYDNNTQTITIPARFTGTKIVNVVLPTDCYNEQVDLYSGQNGQPLNGTVDQNGHNNYGYIAGNFMLTSMNDACVGGKGGGDTTTTTPTTPATPVTVAAAPAAAVVAPTLSDTGLNIRLTSVLAAAFLVAAGYVFTRRNKVSQ